MRGSALLLTACVAAFGIGAYAQPPAVRWQHLFGGSDVDVATSVATYPDGGIIIAGYTRSRDGDVSHRHDNPERADYWVMRLAPDGTRLWQRTLGGSSYDEAYAVVAMPDGGAAVGGEARSDDGDVRGHHGSSDYSDAWIVRLDSTGGTMWQRTLGGADFDAIYAMALAHDGGLILAGTSNATDDPAVAHHGTSDFSDAWIARLSPEGDVRWQRALGGSFNDEARAVVATRDGGFAFAGTTSSTDGDITANHGGEDLWVAKLDSNGTLLWSRTAGGSANDGAYALAERADGYLVAAGYSYSDDGDVHDHHGLTMFSDAWVVTLDASGAIVSTHSYGGERNDEARGAACAGGGCVLACTTDSHDGDVRDHRGGFIPNVWLVGLDTTGGVRWTQSLGRSDRDRAAGIAPRATGGWIVAGTSHTTGAAGESHGADDWYVAALDAAPDIRSTPAPAADDVYPNPFSTSTTIRIPPGTGSATFVLYDFAGREVRRIAEISGDHIQVGRDDLATGTYFYRIQRDGTVVTTGKLAIQ